MLSLNPKIKTWFFSITLEFPFRNVLSFSSNPVVIIPIKMLVTKSPHSVTIDIMIKNGRFLVSVPVIVPASMVCIMLAQTFSESVPFPNKTAITPAKNITPAVTKNNIPTRATAPFDIRLSNLYRSFSMNCPFSIVI